MQSLSQYHSLLFVSFACSWQVPDKEQAGIFYGEGLGLAADPGASAAQRGGIGVTWFNIGRQQVCLLGCACFAAVSSLKLAGRPKRFN